MTQPWQTVELSTASPPPPDPRETVARFFELMPQAVRAAHPDPSRLRSLVLTQLELAELVWGKLLRTEMEAYAEQRRIEDADLRQHPQAQYR